MNEASVNVDRESVLLAGATGLVGGHCLSYLETDPRVDRVHVVVRRPLARPTAPHVDVHVIDFANVDVCRAWLRTVDRVIVCLGTTKKEAGSREAFEAVEFDLVVALAKLAEDEGVARFVVISSAGASPRSWFLYLRTKGRMEAAIEALAFETLVFLRPASLMGKRERPRRLESVVACVAKVVGPLLVGPLRRVRPIDAQDVARVAAVAGRDASGVVVLESHAIRTRARAARDATDRG